MTVREYPHAKLGSRLLLGTTLPPLLLALLAAILVFQLHRLNTPSAAAPADPVAAPKADNLDAAFASWQESSQQVAELQSRLLLEANRERAKAQAQSKAAAAALARASAGRNRGKARPDTRTEAKAPTASAAQSAAPAAPAKPTLSDLLNEERARAEQARALALSAAQAKEQARTQGESAARGFERMMMALILGLSAMIALILAFVSRWQVKTLWKALTHEIRALARSREETEIELRATSMALESTKQQLESLGQDEELYRSIVQSASDYALFLVGRNGKVLSWNPGIETLHGYAASELVGQNLSLLFRPDGRKTETEGARLQVAAQRGRYTEEAWMLHKSGRAFWAEIVMTPVYVENGSVRKLHGFTVLLRDLSARKRAETELHRLFARVEEEAQARDRFLMIASHELKAPAEQLTRELAASIPKTRAAELKARLEKACVQAERMRRIVGEMTELSRAHAGRLGYEFAKTDLSALVRRAIEQMSDRFAASGCALDLQVEAGVVGSFDPARVRQVVVKLASNAIRHGQGKPVKVTLQTQAGRALLSIQDHGAGVDQARRRQIFERFSRDGRSSHQESGFGVGLYIARRVAEGHGGRIWVDSEPGTGATFHLELPFEPTSESAAGLTTTLVAATSDSSGADQCVHAAPDQEAPH